MWAAPDYLLSHGHLLHAAAIQHCRAERWTWLDRSNVASFKSHLDQFGQTLRLPCVLHEDQVRIGSGTSLSVELRERLEFSLKALAPWRKGPFQITDIEIDAEWQSHLKWQRFTPYLPNLMQKKIADIGCNNGYYMYRMAAYAPQLVIGFDPNPRYWYQFQLLQQFTQIEDMHFELLGAEQLEYYPQFFDVVFCMGILYHHPDPLSLLAKIWRALAPEGTLVLECAGIGGAEPIALCPEKRYAKVPGTWFLPTLSCLRNWLTRSGFRQLQDVYSQPLSTTEQRRTSWSEVESLADFLDPEQPHLTIEGYPAPWRHYLVAKKKASHFNSDEA